MGGILLQEPNNGDSDWSTFTNIVRNRGKDSIFVSMTHWDDTEEPVIEAGSYVTINHALYSLTTAGGLTTISGCTDITGGQPIYVMAVPNGDSVTAQATTSPPTWDADKGGWYGTGAAANHRYIAGMYRDTDNGFIRKYIYLGRETGKLGAGACQAKRPGCGLDFNGS